MKAISISPRAKTLNELLKKARRGTIILESADGQRFPFQQAAIQN